MTIDWNWMWLGLGAFVVQLFGYFFLWRISDRAEWVAKWAAFALGVSTFYAAGRVLWPR
jgi:putative flippase GtrA